FDREAAYLRLFEQGLGSSQVKVVEQAVLKGWPLGSDAFKQALELKMQRQVLPAKRGRPRKIVAEADAN
ncbi:MAG: transposase, partial [Janthinobacterium sp.]